MLTIVYKYFIEKVAVKVVFETVTLFMDTEEVPPTMVGNDNRRFATAPIKSVDKQAAWWFVLPGRCFSIYPEEAHVLVELWCVRQFLDQCPMNAILSMLL